MKRSIRILTLATGVFLAGAVQGLAGPAVERDSWGETPEGTEVVIATLDSGSGAKARIASYGALLVSLEVPDREGRPGNVTLSYESLDEALAGGVRGSVIGRFANRIDTGGFEIDGVRHDLETVNPRTSVHIHGGKRGFHRQVWTMEEPTAGAEGAQVILRLVSPDGEEGYPGEVRAEVAYTLTPENVLRIRYEATTSRPTVLNLTNHAYFNLAGSGTVLDQHLLLRCEKRLGIDERKIPTGQLVAVASTPFDFLAGAKVGARIEEIDGGGYDHCFVLPGQNEEKELLEFATLTDPASGREMRVATTKPGVQIYTANHYRDNPHPKWGGICFETQYFPDSPNRPEFPSPLLRPGDTYEHVTEFRFGIAD